MFLNVIHKKIEEKLFYKDKEVLNYEISYPFVSGGNMQAMNRINDFFKSAAEDYRQRAKTVLFNRAIAYNDTAAVSDEDIRYSEPFTARMTVTETLNNENYFSAVWDNEEWMGEERPDIYRFSKTFEAKTGDSVELKHLFSEPKSVKRILTDYIIREIKTEIGKGEDRYFINFEERARQSIRSSNFYLTERSLVIYYGVYDLMIYSAGIKVFEIPFEYLYDTNIFIMKS